MDSINCFDCKVWHDPDMAHYYEHEGLYRCDSCAYKHEKEVNHFLRAERDEAVRLLTAINEIGKRDLSNQKYDGYFESIREFLAKVKP